MNAQPKPVRRRDEKYLAWIRKQKCCVSHLQSPPSDPIEAHHVRKEGHGGMGTKPDDSRAVPLCTYLHRLYHDWGRKKFEETYGIDLEAEIIKLNKEYARQPRISTPRSEQKIKPFKKKPIHRAWAVLTPDGLESFDNHIGFQYPVFATLTDAKLWREEREATGWKIVRCQIRVEGTKV